VSFVTDIAPQSRLSPPAAQNIRHGHTSEPSQSPPLILSDNSPASAISIRKHKGYPIEDFPLSMSGQGPSRRLEVAIRRDMSCVSQSRWRPNYDGRPFYPPPAYPPASSSRSYPPSNAGVHANPQPPPTAIFPPSAGGSFRPPQAPPRNVPITTYVSGFSFRLDVEPRLI
jgi:hypothetical protein